MIRSLKKVFSCLAVSSCIIITGAVVYVENVPSYYKVEVI